MSDDRKPTVKLPAAPRPPVPRLASANEQLHRSETRAHGTRITHVEGRVDTVEGVLGVPRPAPRPPPEALVRERMKSDPEHAFDQAKDGMIAHTKRLEKELGLVHAELEQLRGMMASTFVQFAREFGIEHQLPPQLVKSVPPPPGPVSYPPPKPSPVLGRIDNRSRRSERWQLGTSIAVIAYTLFRFVEWLYAIAPPH